MEKLPIATVGAKYEDVLVRLGNPANIFSPYQFSDYSHIYGCGIHLCHCAIPLHRAYRIPIFIIYKKCSQRYCTRFLMKKELVKCTAICLIQTETKCAKHPF